MSSSQYHPALRRRRRRRPVLHAIKLALPFLLLIAVGLLSAGVIHLVETTAATPVPPPSDLPKPARDRAPVDVRQGWGSISRPDTSAMQLGGTSEVQLEGIMPTSFMENAPEEALKNDATAPQGERGFEGPGAHLLQSHYPAGLRPVPEPRSGLLLAMGLGLLGVRRTH